ncbi:hypothetical protein BC826DRAFT_972355 [Russula brevipes]|nr:hypothetical protein BC826DRAFT_972355 [Russula brevipes]
MYDRVDSPHGILLQYSSNEPNVMSDTKGEWELEDRRMARRQGHDENVRIASSTDRLWGERTGVGKPTESYPVALRHRGSILTSGKHDSAAGLALVPPVRAPSMGIDVKQHAPLIKKRSDIHIDPDSVTVNFGNPGSSMWGQPHIMDRQHIEN